MQVADKVEAFKKNQVAQNALFTRYHLHTGQVLTKEQDPCMDNHLQVDYLFHLFRQNLDEWITYYVLVTAGCRFSVSALPCANNPVRPSSYLHHG